MSAPKRTSRSMRPTRPTSWDARADALFPKVLQRLNTHSALAALNHLECCGADRGTLLEKLHALAFPPRHSSETVLGITPRQTRSLLATMRNVTGMIERLKGVPWRPGTFSDYEPYLRNRANRAISNDFPRLKEEWLNNYGEYMSKTPRDYHEEILLPCLLRDYADALERHVLTLRSIRNHPIRTAALCQLIWHVRTNTGAHWDAEVSEVVNAAESRDNYTVSDHQKWRIRHKAMILRLGPLGVYPVMLPQ